MRINTSGSLREINNVPARVFFKCSGGSVLPAGTLARQSLPFTPDETIGSRFFIYLAPWKQPQPTRALHRSRGCHFKNAGKSAVQRAQTDWLTQQRGAAGEGCRFESRRGGGGGLSVLGFACSQKLRLHYS